MGTRHITAISLPEQLYGKIENIRETLKMTRSRFILEAVIDYIKRQETNGYEHRKENGND